MTKTSLYLFTAFILIFSPYSFSHGGGMDSNGCHNDNSAGNYHCHQGKYSGKTFDSESDFLNNRDKTNTTQQTTSNSSRNNSYQNRAHTSNTEYDRDDYHTRWLDKDNDCQDTRDEVLIEESLEPVQFESSSRCNVVSGEWHDPYSGENFTNPSDLDIDHIVPLKEAHESGASRWPDSKKERYANDLNNANTLMAVDLSQNRSKGSRDPSEWMPDNEAYHCYYLRSWVSVKEQWGLSMDRQEERFIDNRLSQCN